MKTFSDNGIKINAKESNQTGYGSNERKVIDQFVNFGGGNPNGAFGETPVREDDGYVLPIDIAMNAFKAHGGWWSALESGNTKLLSNIVAHEVLHTYLTRAIVFFYGKDMTFGILDSEGHYNAKMNLLAKGDLRHYGMSAYDSEWESGKFNDRGYIMPYFRSIINNYLFLNK